MTDRASVYKERTRKSFDDKAKGYYETFDGKYSRESYPILIDKLERLAFSSLLDIGCGPGTILQMIKQKWPVNISGIDISPEMLEQARQTLGAGADLQLGDSEHLPWEPGSFDIVTCNFSFHHYPNPGMVLQEIRRVLKSSGTLIISDPWMPQPIRFLLNLFLPFKKDGHVKMYDAGEMKDLLGIQGFSNIECEIHDRRFLITMAS